MAHPKTVLVTGASRGIGAAVARKLAQDGHTVAINYREKRKRAEQLVAELHDAGGSATAICADLSDATSVKAMVFELGERFGQLDGLVLNASGGLERDATAEYPMTINRDAQVRMLEMALPIMGTYSRIVFVTSHQAHFVKTHPVPQDYYPVAVSKRAGEDAVRAALPELVRAEVGLSVVSGDMIEGTIIVRLLERRDPDAVGMRRRAVDLPSVEEFAEAIANEAVRSDLSPRTLFVGGSDYLTTISAERP